MSSRRCSSSVPDFFSCRAMAKFLQPLWVEDLVTCLEWSLSDLTSLNQTLSIGGPEFITFDQMVQTALDIIGVPRGNFLVYSPFSLAHALVGLLGHQSHL